MQSCMYVSTYFMKLAVCKWGYIVWAHFKLCFPFCRPSTSDRSLFSSDGVYSAVRNCSCNLLTPTHKSSWLHRSHKQWLPDGCVETVFVSVRQSNHQLTDIISLYKPQTNYNIFPSSTNASMKTLQIV